MTPVEILALVFAVFAAVKIIVILIEPKVWIDKVGKKAWGNPVAMAVVSLVLAVVALAILLQELTIVQIMAAAFFVSFLMALGFAPYSREMMDTLAGKFRDRSQVLRKNWLSILVWAALIVWVLYALFR